ncbi:hypothetical protein C1645_678453, partial [Glomus cerebriforme]
DITTYSLHPGVVKTNIDSHNNVLTSLYLKLLIKMYGITVEQGAANVLYPILSPENKETGKYYHDGIEKEPNKIASDPEVVKKLWDVSEQILK